MTIHKSWFLAVSALLSVCALSGCGGIATPADVKHLKDFHLVNFTPPEDPVLPDRLSLYVDYSTCCALGQSAPFFQAVGASLCARTTDYYAIRGNTITAEDITAGGGVYALLRNIVEVDYADLRTAAMRAATGKTEAVLLTDGEYYTQDGARGNANNPYLADALKAWILRGHDIHIFSEPYDEPYGGTLYHKKRFYILFTDDRLPNNIYSRIVQTVDLRTYPAVDEFHISAAHPQMQGDGNNASAQDAVLESKTVGYGRFEVEDWDGCDWGTIESELVSPCDDETGEPAPPKPVITMGINKNSFGGFRIDGLGLRVQDINAEYADFYNAAEAGTMPKPQPLQPAELEQLMQIDSKEFARHSTINIAFNPDYFDPSQLAGKPYNYLKADLFITSVEPTFARHAAAFQFESIGRPGEVNASVAASIAQCLADAAVQKKMLGQVVYTIYIKAEPKP